MELFSFSYKRIGSFFWKSHKIKGFQYEPGIDKIILYLPNHEQLEIPKWSECYCRLDKGFIKWNELKMKKETNQNITTGV